MYGGEGIELTEGTQKEIDRLEEMGFANLPICITKTPYSFSDDSEKIGRPTGFKVKIQDAKVSAGAGFVVIYTGNIMTIPGLPREPAANNIDVDCEGQITGLL